MVTIWKMDGMNCLLGTGVVLLKSLGQWPLCLLSDRFLTVFYVYGCQVTGLYAARPKHTHDALLKFCSCLLSCYSRQKVVMSRLLTRSSLVSIITDINHLYFQRKGMNQLTLDYKFPREECRKFRFVVIKSQRQLMPSSSFIIRLLQHNIFYRILMKQKPVI